MGKQDNQQGSNDRRDRGTVVNHCDGTNYGIQTGNAQPGANVTNYCGGDNHGIQTGVFNGDLNFNN